jgi:benzoate membrane transport protein
VTVAASSIVAGFITVLVGYTSSAAIVFQAAQAAGATAAELASWMTVLGIGMGLTCIGLSLRYRTPIVTAWSTPGAALLATSLAGVPMGEAIGAFVLCGILITLAGVTGWFERIMNRVPLSLAAAMLAGVLLRFGLEAFLSLTSRFALVAAMFAAYLLGKRWWPRYAVLGVLAAGMAVAAAQGALHFESVRWTAAWPVWTTPVFTWTGAVGIALPLFVVTMASQNVPGVAVLRAHGYGTPVSPLITWTGVASVLLAPFGGFAFNLAAITAAICMGKQAHEDPARRYLAAVAAGVFYLAVGLAGATVGALFAAFPRELVLAVAGFALLATIGNGLATALAAEKDREPALITFLMTASGISLGGIGSAFWGLVAGLVALAVLRWRRPAQG